MVEMTIDSIRMSLMNSQRVVILKEKESDRYLPIWIGPAEADAIAVKLQDMSVPRPLTHDLLQSDIDTLGATVNFIVVTDLQNDTFYAKIMLNVDGKVLEVDSRPSDALALAVRVHVPIYVEEAVLDKAGILLDKETGKPIAPGGRMGEAEEGGPPDEAEQERMSAFLDFIQGLDLDDLGKKDKS
ncbi:MAG: bifunctional nuclease family protein [Dehalococcoidia bacterium]